MAFVVVTTMYAPLLPNQTPKAHAIFGGIVFDPANFGVNATQTVILNALNGLAWTVAKMTIQSLTRSTVNWINSGFEGSPAFVSDLNENLKYLGDAVAEDFLSNLDRTVVDTTGFSIRSPFQDQLNQKLREEYYRTTDSWGLGYNLNQTSRDPKAFLDGNFREGGFNAYFSASQNPANNPFGAYRLASNALWSQIDAEAQKRKAELDWGRGFGSWRGKCNAPASSNGAVSLSKAEKCPFSKIRTPGSVIEDQLANSLGSGIRQLELADSINEIVGALIGQMVNQVLGGIGLSGVSNPSSGGGSSYIDRATSGSQFDQQTESLANGVLQGLKSDEFAMTEFRDSWQKVLTAANAAQTRCGTRSELSDVITKATAGVAKGNAALEEIGKQRTNIQNAAQSTAADKSMIVLAAVTSYQSYLSSPNAPSASEKAEAAQAGVDTSSDENATPSLYTQMVRYQKSCGNTGE